MSTQLRSEYLEYWNNYQLLRKENDSLKTDTHYLCDELNEFFRDFKYLDGYGLKFVTKRFDSSDKWFIEGFKEKLFLRTMIVAIIPGYTKNGLRYSVTSYRNNISQSSKWVLANDLLLFLIRNLKDA